MNEQTTPIKILASEIAWSCPWYSVRRDEILLPDGQRGEYNVVQHPGAVWIVPVTPAGEIVMIYSYRHAVQDWCWEVPAGGLAPGQDPEVAARAELREEVGGTAAAWHYLGGPLYTSNGISDEAGHLFLATGVTLGEPAHEPGEILEIHRKPVAEALAMAHRNQVSDGPSALALLLSAPYLSR